MSDKPLQQIAEIQIDGVKYDIAKNGGDFHIVLPKGVDAYGRPVAEKLDPAEFFHVEKSVAWRHEAGVKRAQALLNLLGNALVSVRTQRDARLGVGEREES